MVLLGGSIVEGTDVGTIGSGRAAIASSAEDVSSTICTVDFVPCRNV